jgi:hypothetical protein
MISRNNEFTIAGLNICLEDLTVNGAVLVTRYPTGYVQRDPVEDTFDILFYLEHHINSVLSKSVLDEEDKSTLQ